MTLNEDYLFESAPEQVRQAFTQRFRAHRVLLRARTRLYKLTEYPLFGPWGVTPWWAFFDFEFVRLNDGSQFPVEGYHGFSERRERIGASEQDMAHATFGVSRNWNAMTTRTRIRLNQDTYAWFGRVASQKLVDPKLPVRGSIGGKPLTGEAGDYQNVDSIGGGYQVYVPNLFGQHVTLL